MNLYILSVILMTSMSCMLASERDIKQKANLGVMAEIFQVQKITQDLQLFPDVITKEIVEYLPLWQHMKKKCDVSGPVTAMGFIKRESSTKPLIFTWDAPAGTFTEWDMQSGKGICKLVIAGGCSGTVNTVSPCGNFLAHSNKDNPRSFVVWSVGGKDPAPVFADRLLTNIFALNFSHDASCLAVTLESGIVKVLRQQSNQFNEFSWVLAQQIIRTVPYHVAFHPLKDMIMLYGVQGKAEYDLRESSNNRVHTISQDPVSSFVYSPLGKHGVTFNDPGSRPTAISPCGHFITTVTNSDHPITTLWKISMRRISDTEQDVSLEKYATYSDVSHASFAHNGLLLACFNKKNNQISVYKRFPSSKGEKSSQGCIIT
jgi:hypothetical protein